MSNKEENLEALLKIYFTNLFGAPREKTLPKF